MFKPTKPQINSKQLACILSGKHLEPGDIVVLDRRNREYTSHHRLIGKVLECDCIDKPGIPPDRIHFKFLSGINREKWWLRENFVEVRRKKEGEYSSRGT